DKYMLRPTPMKQYCAEDVPGSYLSDEFVIEKATNSKQGEKFRSLWNGEIPDGKSHSDADMALAAILAFWCGGDIEQMDRLFRESGLMRDKWDRVQSGSTYGEITLKKAVAHASEFYKPVCKMPATEDFDDIYNRLVEMDVVSNNRYPWNDNGSGRLFADIYRDIARFVPERKKWYIYDGTRWVPDVGGLKTMELAKALSDELIRYAITVKEEELRKQYLKYCTTWQARRQRTIYISDAESVYPIAMSEFDKNIYYLNCENGTLDLRTGEFHEHNPEDKLTKMAGAAYDPSATSDRFLQFVNEVMSNDADKAVFMQKTLGYGLTGDTRYECMFFYYGATTRNGKGTLMESTLNVMGDYGITVRPETIAAKPTSNSQNPTEDIARLAGVRFANISEPRRGLVLNEAQIKSMTGNDTLNARFLHENSFDFKPQFKLYVNTNYLPAITDMTLFSSGRIVIIPFDRHFEEWEQDQNLKYEFSKPMVKSAILNWLIEGYTLLLKEGLAQPASVKAAIQAYEHESDKIRLFADECLEEQDGNELRTSSVYQEYRSWCGENGCYPENSRNFNQALRSIGTIVRKRPKGGGEKTTVLVGYRLVEREFLCG
ncbi:MAG: nucleoside triphosphatase, partial [Clostridiales bacterium]|nr:nucleoside triphosphatase [Clostridiales bacterium]